jgi:NADH:ubiquinone oxidoreductase subunit F (NADH-binding)
MGALRLPAQRVRENLICNADEGDPGAYMDRSVLEQPAQHIEG